MYIYDCTCPCFHSNVRNKYINISSNNNNNNNV